jgi:hypothetical protein
VVQTFRVQLLARDLVTKMQFTKKRAFVATIGNFVDLIATLSSLAVALIAQYSQQPF